MTDSAERVRTFPDVVLFLTQFIRTKLCLLAPRTLHISNTIQACKMDIWRSQNIATSQMSFTCICTDGIMALPLLQVLIKHLSRRCNRAVRGALPTYKHNQYTCDPSLLLVHRLYKRKIQSDLIWYTSTATSQMHPDTARLSTYVDVKHARWLLLSSFVVAAKQHPCACIEEH